MLLDTIPTPRTLLPLWRVCTLSSPSQNNEKFVPNPQHSSPLALSMLRFVGRLMGLSLRTRLCLPFEMPGMIWKRMLVRQQSFCAANSTCWKLSRSLCTAGWFSISRSPLRVTCAPPPPRTNHKRPLCCSFCSQGLQVGFADLRLVDTIICQFITAIETCEEDGLTSDKEFRGES